MSASDLPPTDPLVPYQAGRDERLRGRRAECDGGQAIPGTHFAGRQDFAGTLTGDYREFGPYRWRWYLLADLTRKPDSFAALAVWCESGSLFIEGEAGGGAQSCGS